MGLLAMLLVVMSIVLVLSWVVIALEEFELENEELVNIVTLSDTLDLVHRTNLDTKSEFLFIILSKINPELIIQTSSCLG